MTFRSLFSLTDFGKKADGVKKKNSINKEV